MTSDSEEEQAIDPSTWKEPEFTKEDNKWGLLEKSSFSTLFPKYREHYIRECWPLVENALKSHGIQCELDLVAGSMEVHTTRQTFDPYIIIRSRDLIKLLSRSVPFEQAVKILQDDVYCDIMKIGNIVRNKERFVKRRDRLIGPGGCNLRAMELLTKCYVLVQGNTVAAMGNHKGLRQVRTIVEGCMKNIHPIYTIKTLMIKAQLAQDPAMKHESWDRFLPKLKTNISKRKKPHKIRKKGEYTPFPPPQQPSKIDLQLESGEYFLKENERKHRKRQEIASRQKAAVEAVKEKKRKIYEPPKEAEYIKSAKPSTSQSVDIKKLKHKINSVKKK